MEKLFKNAFFNIVRNGVTLIFPVLSFMYVSRIFNLDNLGKINFSKSLTNILLFLAMLGIQNYGIREGAGIKDNREKLSVLCKELLSINIISGVFVYGIVCIMTIFSDKIGGYSAMIWIYSINIGTTILGLEWLYYAMEDYKYIALRTCVLQLVSLISMILFVHKEEDIYIYIFIQVLSNSGVYLFSFFHAKKYVDFRVKEKLHIGRHIKPVFYIFLTTIFIKTFTDMDTTMLGLLSDDEAVGLYTVGYKMSSVILGIISAASAVTIPRISYMIKNGKMSDVYFVLRKAIHCVFMVGLPICAGSIILSRTFILILSGNSYLEANLTSRILAFRSILGSLNSVLLWSFIIPMGEDKKGIMVTAFAGIINMVANFTLIPAIRQNGAAAATVSAEVVECFCFLWIISKMVSLRELFADVWKFIVATMIMAVFVIMIRQVIVGIWGQMLIAVVAGAILYFLILYWLHCELVMDLLAAIHKKIIN